MRRKCWFLGRRGLERLIMTNIRDSSLLHQISVPEKGICHAAVHILFVCLPLYAYVLVCLLLYAYVLVCLPLYAYVFVFFC